MNVPKPTGGNEAHEQGPSSQETLNMITDLAVGPNLRIKDNVFQGLAILACIPLGVLIGMLVVADRLAGAIVGGFIAIVVGLFGSGIFLMVFRAIRHYRGKHD
jgi:hypothetical protein